MKKGIFCLSVDTELLWGRKHTDYSSFVPRVKKERRAIWRLLELFDKYKTPATWAIVGKILEKPKEKNEPEAKLWYGPDIVEEIIERKIHEIASHSYSHAFFRKIDKNAAAKELGAWKKVVQKNKINSTSFIFPQNSIGHLGLLKKYGFNAYRGPDPREKEILIPAPPPVHSPQVKSGLVNIPGSLYYVSSRGARKYIPNKVRVLKGKMGINRAIKEGKIFHIWFHPVDFVDNQKEMFVGFEQILSYAAQKRATGGLEIKTMQDIAKEVLGK